MITVSKFEYLTVEDVLSLDASLDEHLASGECENSESHVDDKAALARAFELLSCNCQAEDESPN